VGHWLRGGFDHSERRVVMSTTKRDEMRALLKTFGIQADEAVIAHLARNPHIHSLHLRLSLQDLTDYGGDAPAEPLELEIEGSISAVE
jgi:hypothetical protein